MAGVAPRRDRDRAGGARQQALPDAAEQQPADRPARRGPDDDEPGVGLLAQVLQRARREVAGDDARLGVLEALGAGELQQRLARLGAHGHQHGILGVVQGMVREHGDEQRGRAGGVGDAVPERDRVERSLLRVHGDDDVPGHDRHGQ